MRSLALVFVFLCVASTTWADDAAGSRRWYVGLEAGLGVVNGFDPKLPGVGGTGFEVGGAAVVRAGRHWRDHLRFEGQLGWHGASIDDIQGRLDIAASTLNACYDFSHPGAWVRPYLGVGLGVAGGWLRSSLPAAAGPLGLRSGVGMAYVVEGGGQFRLHDRLSLLAAWQFLGTASLISDGLGGTIDPTMHSFMLGIRTSL